MITSAPTVLFPTVPGVAPGTFLPSGPPGPSAYQLAVGQGFTGSEEDWLASLKGAPGDEGPPGKTGPAPSTAQMQVAVQPLVGAPAGLAGLDVSGRLPPAQDQIRAWQVVRAARPVLVAAGGLWSTFLAEFIGGPDGTDGTYEAAQAGVPAPTGGILWTALATYLASLGQNTTQVQATLALIWANAPLLVP